MFNWDTIFSIITFVCFDIIYFKKKILKFYQSVYESRDDSLQDINLNTLLADANVPKLSNEHSRSLNGQITNQEALNALKGMKNDKSPGPDGYTNNFYKFFLERYLLFLS